MTDNERESHRERVCERDLWLCIQVCATVMMLRLCSGLSLGGLLLPSIALSCSISHSNQKQDDDLRVWECVFRSVVYAKKHLVTTSTCTHAHILANFLLFPCSLSCCSVFLPNLRAAVFFK